MSQKGTKIVAILALFGILISIVGTAILYYIEKNNSENQIELSEEGYQKQMASGSVNSGKIEVFTGITN